MSCFRTATVSVVHGFDSIEYRLREERGGTMKIFGGWDMVVPYIVRFCWASLFEYVYAFTTYRLPPL